MAEVTLDNPFTAEQRQQIIAGIEKSQDLINAINRANSAGIDTGTQLQQAQEVRQRLLKIKNTYFPNG